MTPFISVKGHTGDLIGFDIRTVVYYKRTKENLVVEVEYKNGDRANIFLDETFESFAAKIQQYYSETGLY